MTFLRRTTSATHDSGGFTRSASSFFLTDAAQVHGFGPKFKVQFVPLMENTLPVRRRLRKPLPPS